jgi:hypothetical protein
MDITKNSRELGRFRKQEDYLENLVSVFSASIPVLGSIIDRFLVNSNNNYLRKRVYDLFHYLEEITEKIDHNLIDREYLYSEEFVSLLYLILEKLRLTAKKEKINMFAFFMLNCTKKDNSDLRQNNEEYLNLLSDLSLQEISVLSSLYKKQKDIKPTSHEEILKKVDGVMVGREAYENPWFLAEADERIFGQKSIAPQNQKALLKAFLPYMEERLKEGCPLTMMTRHLFGLFNGIPGARRYRQIISEEANRKGAGIDTVIKAIDAVSEI